MEYVTDAQGKTILGNSGTVATVAPSASVVAPYSAPSAVTQSIAASPAPAAITVTGLSTLEQLKDVYEREVARVEADAAAVKSFATSVIASGKADVAAAEADVSVVKALPKAAKIAIAVITVLAYAAGFVTAKFL